MIDTFVIPQDKLAWGDLTPTMIGMMMQDGRLASHFIERQLEIWYPWLTFVDEKGYDHVDQDGGRYDQKCFTKGGCFFAPSNMIGKGRSLDEEVAHAHAKEIKYIITDITEFPKIVVRFVDGSDLLEKYPKCKIPFKHKEEFFLYK